MAAVGVSQNLKYIQAREMEPSNKIAQMVMLSNVIIKKLVDCFQEFAQEMIPKSECKGSKPITFILNPNKDLLDKVAIAAKEQLLKDKNFYTSDEAFKYVSDYYKNLLDRQGKLGDVQGTINFRGGSQPQFSINSANLEAQYSVSIKDSTGFYRKIEGFQPQLGACCYDFALEKAGQLYNIADYARKTNPRSITGQFYLNFLVNHQGFVPIQKGEGFKKGDIIFTMNEEGQPLHAVYVENSKGLCSSQFGSGFPAYYHSFEHTPMQYGSSYIHLRKK